MPYLLSINRNSRKILQYYPPNFPALNLKIIPQSLSTIIYIPIKRKSVKRNGNLILSSKINFYNNSIIQ